MSHMQSVERDDEKRVPSWRLREEAGKRRAAEKRVAELEFRMKELELALKAQRQEWCFRRKTAVTRGAKQELKPEQRGALRKLCCTTPWQPLSASVFGTAQ